MRIIGGTHKGRIIRAPSSLPVRPTTDFAKQALFNILEHSRNLEGMTALDLFSGTGNISYEMASRGFSEITSVDASFACCNFIKTTAAQLGLESIRVIKSDTLSFLKKTAQPYDLIFADPPYDYEHLNSIHKLVFDRTLLNPHGLLILEHSKQHHFEELPYYSDHRKYGNVNFTIFDMR